MSFFIEKIAVPIFILGLKTKRIAKSAVRGKINYHVRKHAPFTIGFLIAGWILFLGFN